ncbi:unnamed protein product, partial [Mesorhabditis belari]|uniref:Uncharacterized protein n=1 Tax=Mesorhabditis belari TaxID=2138241 RepID=A0AAF3EB04_9BILA
MNADPLFDDDDDDIFVEFSITPLLEDPEKRMDALKRANLMNEPKDEPDLKMAKKTTKETTFAVCPVCSRTLRYWSQTRRLEHINRCLDTQATEAKFEQEKQKVNRTMDCPMCRKPLEDGPFQIAHIKKCSREHHVAGSDAMKLYETQKKVSEVRKENGLRHNGAKSPRRKPVLPKPLKGQPRSMNDEQVQLAKAMSVSLKEKLENPEDVAGPSNVLPEIEKDEANDFLAELRQAPNFSIVTELARRSRKRRSYDVIAFTPENCACKQAYELNTRFLDLFKVKYPESDKTVPITAVSEEDKQATMLFGMKIDEMYSKLARLSKLSSILGCMADAFDPLSATPIRLVGTGGGFICVVREILKRRTTVLNGQNAEVQEVDIEASLDVMREWLRFVYASKVEWTLEKNDKILKIAEKYGPEELPAICRAMSRRKEKNLPKGEEVQPEILEEEKTD